MDALNPTRFWSYEGVITLEERAYRCLHDTIISGGLPPGTRLVASRLADHLGVSRTTTTNAIKRLATEGLVVYRPHADATVSSLDEATLKEVFLSRHALEAVIMPHVARHIDEEAMHRLSELNTGIEASIDDDDTDAFRRHEHAYHMRIYAEANMPMLATMLTELWNRIEPYRGRRYSGKSLLRSTVREHREIEAALAARDEEAAIHAMRTHVQTGHDQLAAVLQREANTILVHPRPAGASRTPPQGMSRAGRSVSGSLRSAFELFNDTRRRQGKMFDLAGLLALTACATLCGARSRYGVTRWGQCCHPEIRALLGLPREQGPSVATIHRALSTLDTHNYEHAIRHWLDFHDITPAVATSGEALEVEMRGVHGEELPGVDVLARMTTDFRRAHTDMSPTDDRLLDLPALLLTGGHDRADTRLAVTELRRAILDQDLGSGIVT